MTGIPLGVRSYAASAKAELREAYDLLVLAAVEHAVEVWNANDYPNPVRDAAPTHGIESALHGRSHHLINGDRKMIAALTRLRREGYVEWVEGGPGHHFYAVTPAGDERLAETQPELPDPRCHSCDGPDGRTDLNEASTASSGRAGGSIRYPLCVGCLTKAARKSLAFHEEKLSEQQRLVEQHRMKLALLEAVAP